MSQKNDTPVSSVPFRVGIANFLQKNRTILISVLAIFVVCLAGLGIFAAITTSSANEYATKVEKIQQDFASYQGETDESKKKQLSESIEKNLTDVISKANVSYGLTKAFFIQGNYKAYQKKWTEAAGSYGKIFEKDSKSYLAPVSLVNQAVCLENSGNVQAALAVYEVFEKNFSDNKLSYPQVLFSKGRIFESLNDSKKAVENYKKLLEKYPESNWTKLGRDRIIVLDVNK